MVDAENAERRGPGGQRPPTRYEAALAFAAALFDPTTAGPGLHDLLEPLVRGGPLILRLLPDGLIWRQRLIRLEPAAARVVAELHRGGARTLALGASASVADLESLLALLHGPLAAGESRALVVALQAPASVRLLVIAHPHLTLEPDANGETVLMHADWPAPVARASRRPPPPLPPPWVLQRAAAWAIAPRGRAGDEKADDAEALAAVLAEVPAAAWPDTPPAGLVELLSARAELGGPAAVAAFWQAVEHALPRADHPLRRLLAHPAALVAVAEAFDADPDRLAAPLRDLCRAAPDGLAALLRHVRDPGARAVAFDLAAEVGCDLSGYYRDMLRRPDPVRAREAARGLEPMRGEHVVEILAAGLDHPDAAVRHDVLAALAGRWHPCLRRPVGRLLHDPEPSNRLLALRLVRESGDRRMTGALLAAVRNPGFLDLPPEDRRAFLDALAASADPRALAWFEAFIAQPTLRRNPSLAETQEAAVAALAARGEAPGRELLGELAGRWTLPRRVRRAIHDALEPR